MLFSSQTTIFSCFNVPPLFNLASFLLQMPKFNVVPSMIVVKIHTTIGCHIFPTITQLAAINKTIPSVSLIQGKPLDYIPLLPPDIVKDFCDIVTDDLGNHLGVPLLHKRVSKSTFNRVVEKVRRRLTGWKTNVLSWATSTIPSYSIFHANNVTPRLYYGGTWKGD